MKYIYEEATDEWHRVQTQEPNVSLTVCGKQLIGPLSESFGGSKQGGYKTINTCFKCWHQEGVKSGVKDS